MMRAPSLPRGTTLIKTTELTALRMQARERADYLAAIRKMEPKRVEAMSVIRRHRTCSEGTACPTLAKARGYQQYEHDLGEALLDVMRERGDL